MDYHPDCQGSVAGFYHDMLDLAVTAEQLGYESVWVAEHHFANYGLCPAPPVLLAAMAQQTQRVRLGPAVCVLPFHDPVKVAEEYAVLDVISNGRLEFGVGRGYLEHEYAGHLVDRDESQARFDEALEVLELAWAGQPFEYTGRFHRYPRITLNTLPLQQPQHSVLLACLQQEVPVTVHVALGTETIHQHPETNGAAIGETSYRDFRILCNELTELEGGIVFLYGSAVILPEVFLKALTVVRNLGHQVREFTAVNFDMIRHYRPQENVVSRPTRTGGEGFTVIGHHELMIPLFWQGVYAELKELGKAGQE